MSWTFLLLCLAAQFHYPDFTSHPGLNTVGSAAYTGEVLRLTPAEIQHAGALWYAEKEPVTAGFDTTFQFRLTDQGGLGKGADGLAFVLQNSGNTTVAGRGSAGGWGLGDGHGDKHAQGIPRAIAVFFDTFQNREDHDPSGNYIGIFNNGRPGKMRWPPPRIAYTHNLQVELKDGKVHTARILFRPPVLSVYLDDPAEPALVSTIDVSLVADKSGSAWIGFTASTGSGYENHDLLSWTFNATDVSSAMVTSNISFLMETCLPGKSLCTPERAKVEETGRDHFHVILPANVEWGASVPNPRGRGVEINDAKGTACWDVAGHRGDGCSGPDGNPAIAGALDKKHPAGALVMRKKGGRTYFSVNDTNFADNEGYFEFDVELR